jgi:hypothetical protein
VIASSLGSSLRSLSLHRGVIQPSFWPAVSQHLPNLKELKLMHRVRGNIPGITAYLRTVTQPFTLYIGRGILPDNTMSDDAWQPHNVCVKQEWPPDAFDGKNEFETEVEQEMDHEGSEDEGVADAK